MFNKELNKLKIFMLLLLATVAYMPAVAQSTASKAPQQLTMAGFQSTASKEAALLKRKLNLDDEQEKKLQTVIASFYESVLGLNVTDSLERSRQLLALENKKDGAIKRLLTGDQYKLYTAGNEQAKQQQTRNRQQHTDKLKADRKN